MAKKSKSSLRKLSGSQKNNSSEKICTYRSTSMARYSSETKKKKNILSTFYCT